MATPALNLFPARIQFVNSDGTLTPEAYRSLQALMQRVGGPLGDNGVDVFGDIASASVDDSAATDMVIQPHDHTAPPIETLTLTGTPYTYTATRPGMLVIGGGTVLKIEFIRDVTVSLVSTYGEFNMTTGDSVRVTYSTEVTTYVVVPTIQFIPR